MLICAGPGWTHAQQTPAPGSSRLDPPQRPFVRVGPVAIGSRTFYPYRIETHCHTRHSPDAHYPSSLTTVQLLALAEHLGLDAVVVTDHGDSFAARDFPGYRGPIRTFPGREVGGPFGHALIWNVAREPFESASETSLAQRARFAHANGGLLALAHPGWRMPGLPTNPLDWFTVQAVRRGGVAGEVDAVELWNGQYYRTLDELVQRWVSLLQSHVYVPIVGGSDFHAAAYHRLGHAHNLVFCDWPDLTTCPWPALRSGRVVISDGPFAVLSVDDALPGERVTVSAAPLHVLIGVEAPEGGRLRLHVGPGVERWFALEPSVSREIRLSLEPPTSDTYVWIDILRPHEQVGDPSLSLVSNPVLVNTEWPERAWR